ncbi:hypothetical protein A5888_004248 [Enterococcus sp. 9E7_DIV0242]|uniref:Uncharacterized protein n=1 Tax=Candidatus Enterococcus clewellii TaxID=1834193 RepID=A0AAQ3VYN6_9ENTE
MYGEYWQKYKNKRERKDECFTMDTSVCSVSKKSWKKYELIVAFLDKN